MGKSLLSFLLFFLAGGYLYAQTTVKGVVTSSDSNTPLPGVSVSVKGTSRGTVTNSEGQFSVAVPQGSKTLVISYIGFVTSEVDVTNKTTVSVILQEDSKVLNEVMVIGYGTVSKEGNVGASAQINAEAIKNRANSNALNSLIGATPGLQATQSNGAPGSAPTIRVRGFGSISASNDPLYVVDGVPYTGNTANINPDDIESISVLKDASTTAIYGSRGSNGVVMITTKKGKNNRNNLNFNASVGAISRGLPEYERVSAEQYYPLMWEVQRNTLQYGSLKIPREIAGQIAAGQLTSYNNNTYSGVYNLLRNNPFNVANNEIVDANGVLNPNAKLLYADDLNWEKAIQRGGKSRQNYNISYDGGSDKSDYFGSVGYTKEQGYLLNSDFERFTGRVSVNTQPTKWFKTGFNLNGSYSKANVDATDGDGGTSVVNPFYISRFIGPIYPVYRHDATTGDYILDANGNRVYDQGDNRPFTPGRHAIWENELNQRKQVTGVLGARTYATINIMPGLKATTNISFDLQDRHRRFFDNSIIGDGAPAGRATHYLNRTTAVTFNQLVEYDKSFGKHNLNVLGGHESYSYKLNYMQAGRTGMIVDGITELANFATVLSVNSYEDNSGIESYFARANYDFDKKYILSASIRRDGNSKFSREKRWANFWSLGGAYNLEKEDFLKGVNWVEMLKLRASYGVVGNDNLGTTIGLYPYQGLYDLGRNNNTEAGYTQSAISNNQLTWETGKNFDAGVDFSFFKHRLSGSVEFFNRVTDGLIFRVPLALSNGGIYNNGGNGVGFSINSNIGNLYNRGVELSLSGDIVRTQDFKYSATLNVTSFKNKITKMPDTQKLIISGTKAYSVGHSIYDFYLREFAGVDSETGASLYKTNITSNNTKIVGSDTLTTVLAEANLRYTGMSSIPKFYGSMNHNLSYKGLTLSLVFTYQVGGKVYDGQYAALMHGGSYGTAMHVDALKRWQNPGDVTNVPRFDNGNVANLSGTSTRFLTDASFLQLNNVTLSYAIPATWLTGINAKTASIYFSGENLGLLSARKGMNVTGSFTGTTDNTYNFNRVISIGARLGF